MKIVVDENIPFGREAFSNLGDVHTRAGRAISPDDVRDADLLMVRSVTKVNAQLLDRSSVRFVGTATIGEDHVDTAYLASKDIGFASAPGCNANSVGEYIAGVLLELANWRGFSLPTRRLGIIGHGNVGKKVEEKARALGMECVLNDPPLEQETNDPKYRPLAEVLRCEIITLHVPLEKSGPHPTHHMVDESFCNAMKTGVILINTSRGPVVDGNALKTALEGGRIGASVLDVWENEPNIDTELLANCALGTPHIAGYSYDGKVNGTKQIHDAACRFLGVEADWDPAPLLPAPECPEVTVDGATNELYKAVRAAVHAVYDVGNDDRAMRELAKTPEAERAALFDRLRKEYPRRREFHHTRAVVQPANEKIDRILSGLGFKLDAGTVAP